MIDFRSEIYASQEEPYKKDFSGTLISAATKASIGMAAYQIAMRMPTGIAPEKLRYIDKFTINGLKWHDPMLGIKTAGQSAKGREVIWNSLKFVEEQLFKIPRTFSLSTFYGNKILSEGDFELSRKMLNANAEYLEYISEGKINLDVIDKGVFYRKGSLYGGDGQMLLKHAEVVPGQWAAGEYSKHGKIGYTSRFSEALHRMHGFKPSGTDFIVTGGQKWYSGASKKIGAFATVATENYLRLLDDPFELLAQTAEKLAGKSSNISKASRYISTNIWERLFLKNQFGVGGETFLKSGNTFQLLKRHTLRGMPKMLAAGAAYFLADRFLKRTPVINDTALGYGISGGAAKLYQIGTNTYARISDTAGLTELSKWQEEEAQGSTSLLANLAFPASFAIAGGTLSGGISGLSSIKGTEPFIQRTDIGTKPNAPKIFRDTVSKLEDMSGVIGRTVKEMGLSKLGRTGAFAAIGASIGLALRLPFLLGSLGSSKSHEELERMYSGEEMVPVRRGRFWEFGCVHEDTPILTKKGLKKIIDVVEGDEVVTKENQWKSVYACVRQKMSNKKLFNLKVWGDDHTIRITGNHEIPSMINGDIQDRYLYDIINVYKSNKVYVGVPIVDSRKYYYFENEYANIIALFLLHGKIVDKNTLVFEKVSKVFSEEINKFFNTTKGAIISTMYSEDVADVKVSGKKYGDRMGLLTNNGTYLYSPIANANIQFYKELLSKLAEYSGDKISLASREAALFVRNVFLRLSYICRIEDNSIILDKDTQSAFIDDGTLWVEVTNIEKDLNPPKFVYDLAVEDHLTYTADICTIHNTSPFEGTEIDHFAPHWTVRQITDAHAKGRTPNEYYNNPLRHLVARLFDPYATEKALDEERPYVYWGATDFGFGVMEKLGAIVKQAFKPTVSAHPESLGVSAPNQKFQEAPSVPTAIEGTTESATTMGYAPKTSTPHSLKTKYSALKDSVLDAFGIQGFAAEQMLDLASGGRDFSTPEAVYEHSGRINSAQRKYWDESIGGAFGTSEAYRRLNSARPYYTEYLSSSIRNTMPSWMPEEFRYGDPYASIPHGESRLPGRGYAATHKEVEGLGYEEYPLVHRLNILNMTAPKSPQYYYYDSLVSQQIANENLNQAGEALYEEVHRQRESVKNDTRFDDGGDTFIGKYNLITKQLGRSLPTEALFPVSPVHKFSGQVDPITEYKSFNLYDKQFKLWQNPYSDYIVPAFNRTVGMFSLAEFVPPSAQEHNEIESYFIGLQDRKNQILRAKANMFASAGDYESAAYFRGGIRKTIIGHEASSDLLELKGMLPLRQQRYIEAFADSENRDEVLQIASPEMQQILEAQWDKRDHYKYSGSSETFKKTRKVQSFHDMEAYNAAPGPDWIGYAPGVNLNAFKVKLADHLGKNIRDFNLWRDDERAAHIVDSHTNASKLTMNKLQNIAHIKKQKLHNEVREYLTSIGSPEASISISPTIGANTTELHMKPDRYLEIRRQLIEQGEYHY